MEDKVDTSADNSAERPWNICDGAGRRCPSRLRDVNYMSL